MGKKKQKANAFSVFMHEFIEKERRAGRHHTKEQWASVADPHFKKLTADQKEAYKQKAKAQPARTVVVPPKYTSHGVPLDVVEREQRELAEKQKYMERKVSSIVEDGFLENDISVRPFIFIMANYFYKTNGTASIYPPAEIAAVKFNFKNAIYQQYHTYVNPGSMTIGYACDARDRSERVHRLPPPNTPDVKGEKNYERIYAGILDVIGVRVGQTFSKDDPKRPYVFIRGQDMEMIESILDQLSNEQWRQTFDVFTLELLFNRLKNKVVVNSGGNPIRITVTNQFIEQDRYDATPNIACDFHELENVPQHCALSYVTRWFYLFADHICEKIDVELVAGRHLPANAALKPSPTFEDNIKDDSNDDFKNDRSSADVGASGSRNGGGPNGVKKERDDFEGVTAHSDNSKIRNEHDSDSSEPDDY